MLELKRVKEFQEVMNGYPAVRGIGWSYWLVALALNTAYGSLAIWIVLDQFAALIRYALILCCSGLPWVFYLDWVNHRAYLNEKARQTRSVFRQWKQELEQVETRCSKAGFLCPGNSPSAG